MSSANITPDVVRWAMQKRGITLQQIADKIPTTESNVTAWESGESRPTFRQAQELARVLRVPLGYLFLSQRPDDAAPLPDLRTVTGAAPASPSLELLDTINDVIRKQLWYRESMSEDAAEPLEFVAKYSPNSDVSVVADDIRERLGIDDDLRNASDSWDSFYRCVIGLAENEGILVMRSGVALSNTHRPLEVSEFRGFAISDDLAPVIFINSKDAKVAQIFTLAHELAHIWIGESGISNPDFGKTFSNQFNVIERFCNKVAAEILVPAAGFKSRWRTDQTAIENTRMLARFFRVSTMVALIQAHDIGLISSYQFSQLLKSEYTDHLKKPKKSGGDYYANIFARNSHKLVGALTAAMEEGRTLYKEGARLLGVNVSTIHKIAGNMP